jgi:hypothetical protein
MVGHLKKIDTSQLVSQSYLYIDVKMQHALKNSWENTELFWIHSAYFV